jgi:S1-C subfamily serine protease
MNKLWDPPASQEDAIDQLRYKTQLLGGNAIANVLCESVEGTSLGKNCWSSVTCYGTAIRVTSETPKGIAKKPPILQGTGFFVDKLPIVVTNYHVVGDTDEVEIVLQYGQIIKGRVIKRDEANDLPVVNFNEFRNAPQGFQMFPSYKVKSGQDIYVIGYPLGALLGDSPSITRGIISSTAGLGGDSRHLRITAQINPGNSGGPLLDTYGRVIGVVSHTLNKLYIAKMTGHIPEGTNFAVKSDVLLNMFDETKNLVNEQIEEIFSAEKIFSVYSKAVVMVRAIPK